MDHRRRTSIFSLAVACVCALCAVFAPTVSAADIPMTGGGAAVTGQAQGVGYAAKLYNADNGLPTSEANTVYASSDGFIWLGGYSGLIRYDGTSFERQSSSGGITSVNCIFEDSRKRLWVGTNDNGLVIMHNGKSLHISCEEGLPATSVNTIAEDGSGNILVGTKQGLCYFDSNLRIETINDSQLRNSYISELKTALDGAVIGTTYSGAIFRIRDLRMTEYYNGSEIGTGEITAVLPNTSDPDKIWFGTNEGYIGSGSFADSFASADKTAIYFNRPLAPEEREEGSSKSYERVTASEPVNYLYYSAGRLWVLMASRIFYADWTGMYWQLEKSLLDAGINRMCEDFEGNLWFSSRRQGVMKIAANKFLDLSDRAGLETRVVNTTCMRDEMIYIGTDTGLQVTDRFYTAKAGRLNEYLGNSRIRCISVDSDRKMWISTFSNELGLVCFTDSNEIFSITEADGLPSNKVRCTTEAPDGAVLAATNGGLAVIRGRKVERTIDASKGLANTVILTVEAASDGKYYLGSDGDGIYVADGNNITHLSRADGLTSDIIMRIKKDEKRGVFWIVTSNSIEYMKDGVIKPVENFPYTNNYDICFDSSDKAWVLSSNGIYVVNADDMLTGDKFDYAFYSTADGLASVPTGNSFSYTDENGNLYIAGREGVSQVNIDSFFVQSSDIKFSVPYIEGENGRYYPDDNNVFTLPPEAGNITIYNYALTYMMHDPQIEYFLKGADNQPIVVNKSDMAPARYTNLGGGKYEFCMSLIDNTAHTARQTVTYTIEKKRAFFEEWWFYVIIAFITMLLIAGLVKLILRRKTALFIKKEQEQKRLFYQTANALVNAIDAKDKYTHGHSSRVADYSKKLAEMAGKSDKEIDEIYYAALLHDVGKIGIPGSIINKDGRLTDEEYATIKQHPTKGVQILRSITEFPYLSIGAHHHHERYDGKGYPDGLKGEEIPEMARIIAVADAYDAMTSKRSYRDPIPQQKVREEFVKGAGTQFDPEYARHMLHLIDVDTEYEMQEREELSEAETKTDLIITEYRSAVSEGILLTNSMTTVHMNIMSDEEATGITPVPSMILFDSLDGKVHTTERKIRDLLYFEYGEIWFDGRTVTAGARKMQTKAIKTAAAATVKNGEYRIEAARIKDHAIIRIITRNKTSEVIIALPDSSRFLYIGFTGEHCRISGLRTEKSGIVLPAGYIPRIAEEISYINVPAGDIPNIQADGYRTAHSDGIEITDGLKITFHTMSLPTARLVWHCPYIDLYCSDDGKVRGANYRDLMFMRIDGECWDYDPACATEPSVTQTAEFGGWEAWKDKNKEGFDCTVTFTVTDNSITISTENAGISVRNTTTITDVTRRIYAALTGDQCAITNIRISGTTDK